MGDFVSGVLTFKVLITDYCMEDPDSKWELKILCYTEKLSIPQLRGRSLKNKSKPTSHL